MLSILFRLFGRQPCVGGSVVLSYLGFLVVNPILVVLLSTLCWQFRCQPNVGSGTVNPILVVLFMLILFWLFCLQPHVCYFVANPTLVICC